MQQFVVPQFIDVEDKIIGPITVRQFLILLSAAITLVILFRILTIVYFAAALFIIGGGAIIFSFVKVNGQAFHFFVLNIFASKKRPSLRVWRKNYTKEELQFFMKEGAKKEVEKIKVQKQARRTKIRDLALVVNTGGYYQGEQ